MSEQDLPWLQNDKLFFHELRRGHAFQYLPAVFFSCCGLDVEMFPLRIRAGIGDACRWIDEVDLKVCSMPIEVKSRGFAFFSPRDFPFARPFIDTVSGYEAKKVKPVAYVFVSQLTGGMVCVGTSCVKPDWTIQRSRDRVRGIDEDFYCCPKNRLRTMQELVEFIRRKTK